MKKAFTLLEVVISISIFMIILFFLYNTIDNTKISNAKFEQHLQKHEASNHLYKIIAEDISQAIKITSSKKDRNNNTILIFQSYNTFHNPFYKHITYMLASNNKLVRIESKKGFKIEGLDKSDEEFYENSYIDIIYKDVEKFLVLPKNDKYIFIIETKDKKRLMFPVFKMKESN